jgi:hypothetical protein
MLKISAKAVQLLYGCSQREATFEWEPLKEVFPGDFKYPITIWGPEKA